MKKILVLLLLIAAAFGVYWYINKDSATTTSDSTGATAQNSDATPDSAFETDLPAKSWQLAIINSKSGQTKVEGSYPQAISIEFNFADNSYKGYAGCNTFSGKYQATGNYGFSFGSIASTKMACDYIDLEGAIFEAMRKVNTWGIKGDQLVFTEDGGYTDLVYSAK